MALRYECDKCDVEIVPLFAAPNPINGKTEQVLICTGCKDRYAVQSLPDDVDPFAAPPVPSLIPETAPERIEIKRDDPVEALKNLTGRTA